MGGPPPPTPPDPRPLEERRTQAFIGADYAPLDWLALAAQAEIRRTELDFATAPPAGQPAPPNGRGGFEVGSAGLADVRLGATARLWRGRTVEAGIALGLRLPTGRDAVRDEIPAPGDATIGALLPRAGQPGQGVVSAQPAIWARGAVEADPLVGQGAPAGRLDWGLGLVAAVPIGESEAGFVPSTTFGGTGYLAWTPAERLTGFAAVTGAIRRGEADAIDDEPLIPGQIRTPDFGTVALSLGTEIRDFGPELAGWRARRLSLALSVPLTAPEREPKVGLTTISSRVEIGRREVGGLDLTLALAGQANIADRAGRDPFSAWRAGLGLSVSGGSGSRLRD